MTIQDNEDINDRESVASGSELVPPIHIRVGGSNASLGTSATGDYHSRRLYVITEES